MSRLRTPSPSFAQTQADTEFTLFESDYSDLDDEDLRNQVGNGEETYELTDRDDGRHGQAGESSSGNARVRPGWDDDDTNSQDEADEAIHDDDAAAMMERRASASTTASFQLYTPDEERTVRRKFDRKLVVFVALLYMLSFLDRSNIGNARIAGMDEDLQTDPPREDYYEWALTAFYITYIAFEWMSILFKLIPAHIYLSMVVLSWGLIASLQAIAPSYPVLIGLRVLLGIGEAGFTGIPFYLSFFFKREELAFRTAIFISAAPLATTFASSLAWVIVKFAQKSPIAPWRLLFLIEGFPSVLVSVIAWSLIPDSPQTAPYLTKREKKVARLRLRNERNTAPNSKPSSGFKYKEFLAVLADPVAWVTAFMFFLTNMAYSSLPVFLPKILTEMGHDVVTSQALSAPPYLVAFITVLLTAHISDRKQSRAIPLALHAFASAAGYGVCALAQATNMSPLIRYLAIYPAAMGFFNVVTLIITWTINNQQSSNRQGGGFALMQLIGQCGPIVGTRLYPDADGPFDTPGMRACAGAMALVACLAFLLWFLLNRRNRGLDAAQLSKGAHGAMVEEVGFIGSGWKRRTPAERFRYML